MLDRCQTDTASKARASEEKLVGIEEEAGPRKAPATVRPRGVIVKAPESAPSGFRLFWIGREMG